MAHLLEVPVVERELEVEGRRKVEKIKEGRRDKATGEKSCVCVGGGEEEI